MTIILCALNADRQDLTDTDAREIRDTLEFYGIHAHVLTTETMELDIAIERSEDVGVAAHLLRKRGLDIL